LTSARPQRSATRAEPPKWWLPDAFAFIDEVPKTSTGKFDKKRLREWVHDGRLPREPGMASSPTA
jgi:fatty-acyl-CoA synthase